MDDYRLWGDLRTDAEINGWYNKRLTDPATLASTENLLVYYTCDDVASAFVHDDASTFHGVLVNLDDDLAKLTRYTQVCHRHRASTSSPRHCAQSLTPSPHSHSGEWHRWHRWCHPKRVHRWVHGLRAL
jgi:hypothetical protein